MEIKNFKPLRDLVLIKPEKKEEKVINGLILPDSESKFNFGKVVEKGEGLKDIDINKINIGDTVIYKDGLGEELVVDGDKHLIMTYGQILGLVEPK